MRPYVEHFNGRVDWHLSGHVHFYQRVRPIYVTATSHEFRAEYGRGVSQGVGYLLVPPAGQWPRRSDQEAVDIELAFHPQDQGSSAYEIGYSIIHVIGEDFSLWTYGLGDVDGRNAHGYGDVGEPRLIDALHYTRATVPSGSNFPMTFYRGSSNGWKATAMTLTAENVWETTFYTTPGDHDPAFKFFTNHSGDTWYGDDGPFGRAQSDWLSNIPVRDGPGTYRIVFDDYSREYSVDEIFESP